MKFGLATLYSVPLIVCKISSLSHWRYIQQWALFISAMQALLQMCLLLISYLDWKLHFRSQLWHPNTHWSITGSVSLEALRAPSKPFPEARPPAIAQTRHLFIQQRYPVLFGPLQKLIWGICGAWFQTQALKWSVWYVLCGFVTGNKDLQMLWNLLQDMPVLGGVVLFQSQKIPPPPFKHISCKSISMVHIRVEGSALNGLYDPQAERFLRQTENIFFREQFKNVWW